MTKLYQTRLKQAREEYGWSQRDVAEQIGTDPKTVSRWERGVAYPSPYFRQKLAELFKKSVLELKLFDVNERELEHKSDSAEGEPVAGSLRGSVPPQVQGNETVRATDQRSRALNSPVDQGQEELARTVAGLNRKRMLGRLRHAYSELLEYSLRELVWIELRLAELPDAVQNARNRLLPLSRQHEQLFPPGTSLLEVYETSQGELLILGEPGAGKSTLLLHLARTLVQRAEAVETHSLPVILRLSSWAEQQPALEDWMGDQIATTYDISPKLSRQWVRNEQILPLLDGLDEMDAASRAACITALNVYHQEHLLVPLVICSRRAEYEDAAREQKLALQDAVLIQPLTLEQVFASLEQIGQPLEMLQKSLQTNQALQELTNTPLMLSILMLAYSRIPLLTLSHETETLQKQVWRDYVARMIEQKGSVRSYPFQQTSSWLSWLARNLQKHCQTVFYLEHVQSDWLPDGLQEPAFWLTTRLPIILLGMLSSYLIGLFLQTVFDLTTGIQAVILGGMLAGCLSQPSPANADVDSAFVVHLKQRICNLRRVSFSIGIGLLLALSFGGELGPGYGWGDWLRDGLVYGGILGFVCWLLLAWLPLLSPARFTYFAACKSVYLRYLFSTPHLQRAGVGSVAFGLAYGLSTALSYRPIYGPSAGLNMMLSYGFVLFLISLIVEKNSGDIRLTERLRWTWSRFGQVLRSFEHCVTSGLLTLGLVLIVGISYGLSASLGFQLSASFGFRLSYGQSAGLSTSLSAGPATGLLDGLVMGLIVGGGIGLGYWLGLGLFQSIGQEQIDDLDRQSLNQGVHRSARNSTTIGLLSGVVIGSLGFLGYGLSYWINERLSQGPDVGLSEGLSYALGSVCLFLLSGSLVGWAVSGGWAVLRHVVLRWLLQRRGLFPWAAQRFLEDATARILLLRVGGGYSFIHRLLQEYFAQLEDGSTDKSGTVSQKGE